MDPEKENHQHSIIVELESRRIVTKMQCVALTLIIESREVDSRARQTLIMRREDFENELRRIDESLQLLRGAPPIRERQSNSEADSTLQDTGTPADRSSSVG